MGASLSFDDFFEAGLAPYRPPPPCYDYWERCESFADQWPDQIVAFCGGKPARGKEHSHGCFATFFTRAATFQPLANLFGVVPSLDSGDETVLTGMIESLRFAHEHVPSHLRLLLITDQYEAISRLGLPLEKRKMGFILRDSLVQAVRRAATRISGSGGSVQFSWRCFEHDWRPGFKQGTAAILAVQAASQHTETPYVLRPSPAAQPAVEASGGPSGEEAGISDA